MPADFYDLLEVAPDASQSEIKRAYREKATRYHPDVNDDPRATDQFATLNKARDVLTDSKERTRYDRLGHRDYVSQHLDGLPTMTRPGQDEDAGSTDAGDETTDSDSTNSGDDTPEYGKGTGGSGTATNRTRSSSSARSASSSGRSSSTTSASSASSDRSNRSTASKRSPKSGSSANASSASGDSASGPSASGPSASGPSASGPSASGPSAAGASSTAGTTTSRSDSGKSASSRRTSTAGGTGPSTRTGSARSPTSPSARRIGLRRGWIASIFGLVLYFAGLATFATVAGDGVTEALVARSGDPVAALTARSPLANPANVGVEAVRLATAGQPTLALLVPVGLVALPLTVTVSVVRFGQGTAYLYGAGVVVPLLWVGMRTAIGAPLGADLVGLVAIPLLATLWFLVDVGRYLRG